MKKTELYDVHKNLNATTGVFEGWKMPLWYPTGQIKEHIAIRESAGIFDTSHMGEFLIKGNAEPFFEKLLTADVSNMKIGEAKYSFMLNYNGGVVDDCILYKKSDKEWMLVVNAGNIEKDFAWLEGINHYGVELDNISEITGKLDLQGPLSPKIMANYVDADILKKLRFFRFKNVKISGMECILSRTGYTGEIGFEIYTDKNNSEKIWSLFIEKGAVPSGLGARDTLRLEAGLPLYGHELNDERIPVNTPWNFAIDMDHDFIGKDILLNNSSQSYIRAFRISGRKKPHGRTEVYDNDVLTGDVTSFGLSISTGNIPIGFAFINTKKNPGDSIKLIDERHREYDAIIVENPIYKGTSRKSIKKFL